MKKRLLVGCLIFCSLLLGACSKKEEVQNLGANMVAPVLGIGKKILPIKLKDQFEKEHILTADIKKLIFVFKKDSGHLVREYFNKLDKNYLKKNKIVFIADLSPMPSFIRNYIAIPDLKKHQYPIWLLLDEKNANKYKNLSNIEKIMIVELDNFVIKGAKFISTTKELDKELKITYK
jgi:hypothetical protein